MKSLLGHIVLKSTNQAENLATESLYYILSNSNSARNGLTRFLKNIDSGFNPELFFNTQAYGDDECNTRFSWF